MSNKAMNCPKEVAFIFVSLFSTVQTLQTSFPFNFTVTPDCQCPFLVDAVCGRSGPIEYTYMNKCVLDCTKKNKKDVELLYPGACCREKICSPFVSPVCDANGKMYPSPCAFDNAQCIELRKFGRHLSMDSTSEKCSCVKPCKVEWDPVCDNNGRTHANRCTFENSQCLYKQQHNETISIDYEGTCCDDICFTGNSPFAMCDSKGNTHSDLCSFYKTKCQIARRTSGKDTLRVSSLGACPKDPPAIRDTFHYFIQRFPTQ